MDGGFGLRELDLLCTVEYTCEGANDFILLFSFEYVQPQSLIQDFLF